MTAFAWLVAFLNALTANTEGDPVVALAGAVKRADRLKKTHQSMDNAALFQPITKYSAEVEDANNIPEAVTNAFRAAASGQAGAAFLSFPQDVTAGPATAKPVKTISRDDNIFFHLRIHHADRKQRLPDRVTSERRNDFDGSKLD